MCGIAGAIDIGDQSAEALTRALNGAQVHRGPDDTALWAEGNFALGNTRLAIQDPTPSGNHPFESVDGRYLCVFNGEIYNYKELIKIEDLSLNSQTDGAIIPLLWMRYGEKCLHLLRGMWAIAIIDRWERTLTLARDPFGIKPLYTRHLPTGAMAFASEPRPLARIPPKAPVDARSFHGYLRFGAVPSERSGYENVYPVAANRWVTYHLSRNGRVRRTAEGPIEVGPFPYTEGASGDVWPNLLESVRLHLRSDTPTALLLSSGVDSTLLACAARQADQTVNCFTVKVPGPVDESDEAATTAHWFGHDHQVVPAELTPAVAATYFESVQRPSVDGLNTFLVSKAIHDAGFKVALSGVGGDEAIAGYPHMRLFGLMPILHGLDYLHIAGPVSRVVKRQKLKVLLSPGGPRSPDSFDVLYRSLFPDPDIQEAILGDGTHKGHAPDRSSGTRGLIEAEVENYLQPTLLPDADAFSMHWSVELRVPFLDLEYFRSAATAARPFLGKRALVAASRDRRVREVARNRKRGFGLPMSDWMSLGPLAASVTALRASDAPVWCYLRPEPTLALIDRSSGWARRWSIALLNSWLESYLAQPGLGVK